MKRISSLMLLLFAALSCSSGAGIQPAQGNLRIAVNPNPIVAYPEAGSVYRFPFTVTLTNIGGRAVNVQQVSVDVYAGNFRVYSDRMEQTELAKRGVPVVIEAGRQVEYPLSPKETVPDASYFDRISANVQVEGVDESGSPAIASVRVTVQPAAG